MITTPIITTADLKLGDFVRMSHMQDDSIKAAYVVRQITDTHVHLWRPYTVASDFSYTGGVLTYVGIEEFSVELDSKITWRLLRKTALK